MGDGQEKWEMGRAEGGSRHGRWDTEAGDELKRKHDIGSEENVK